LINFEEGNKWSAIHESDLPPDESDESDDSDPEYDTCQQKTVVRSAFTNVPVTESSVSKATDGPLPSVIENSSRNATDKDVIGDDVVVHSSASPASVIPQPPRSRSGTPELQCPDVAESPSPQNTTSPPDGTDTTSQELLCSREVSNDGCLYPCVIVGLHTYDTDETRETWVKVRWNNGTEDCVPPSAFVDYGALFDRLVELGLFDDPDELDNVHKALGVRD